MIDSNSMMLLIMFAIPMMLAYSAWQDDGFKIQRRHNPFKDESRQ